MYYFKGQEKISGTIMTRCCLRKLLTLMGPDLKAIAAIKALQGRTKEFLAIKGKILRAKKNARLAKIRW